MSASMGPRSDERGNPKTSAATSRSRPTLQWGRAPMSAEMLVSPSTSIRDNSASMGPRSDERGNFTAHGAGLVDMSASMGPRSDERGNGGQSSESPR